MDDDGGTLGIGRILGRSVYGVQFITVRIGTGNVLEDAFLVQVVVPGHHAGSQGVGLGAGALDIGLTVLRRLEGIVRHELAGEAAGQAVRREEERCAPEDESFQCHSFEWFIS